MERDVALAIVLAAKSGGYEEADVPDDADELFAMAEKWVTEAKKVDKQAGNIPTVREIIALAEGMATTTEQVAQESEEVVDIEAPEASPPGAPEIVGDNPTPTPVPSSSDNVYAKMSRERLPIPPEMEGEAPEMPLDLTGLDDRQIRYLHGAFNAYLARTNYLISLEALALARAKSVHKHTVDAVRNKIPKIDEDTGKAKLAADIDAEVNAVGEVEEWSLRIDEHESMLIMLKGLAGIYSSNVSVLSREWSMRSEEWSRSEGRRT